MKRTLRSLPVVVVFLLAFLNVGCTSRIEGYRVVSFDSTTGQWVILRSGMFDGKYLTKRLIVVCDFYTWGDHESISGPNACTLRVGQLMVPRYATDAKGNVKTVLAIFEDPNRLTIMQGDGDDQVMQQFFVLKNEVVRE